MKLFNKGWDILHIEERPDLDSSANYIRVVKSRRVSWAGHVARKVLRRDVHFHLVGKAGRKEFIWKT
jgi:homoaconitase/3-isopropylmalate dehydratase large subunit